MGLKHAHHLGRVGHWAEQAVAAGMVSIHFTNVVSSDVLVAPWGGAEGQPSRTRVHRGVPRPGADPIVLNWPGPIAGGKVRVAYDKGVPIPPAAWSTPTATPPARPVGDVRAEGRRVGALMPFAAHKGYALAMVCELLGAALIGGETMRPGDRSRGRVERRAGDRVRPSRLRRRGALRARGAGVRELGAVGAAAARSAASRARADVQGDPERRARAPRVRR